MNKFILFSFLFCVVFGDSFFNKIIYQPIQFHFCSRFYTRDGAIGCHTGNSGTSGVLLPIRKEEDIEFISTSDFKDVIVVLRMQFYENATLNRLVSMPNVRGILLSSSGTTSGYSPAPTTPHGRNTPEVDLALHPDMEWNPTGSGLLYKDIPIPIMKILDSKEDYDVWLRCDYNMNHLDGNSLYYVDMGDYMGPEVMNSPLCLEKGACQPIGGQSVIGYQGSIQQYEKIIMIATNMDTIGDIYSFVKGGSEIGVSIAVFLSVLEQVHSFSVPENTVVLFALFQGDHWGGLGSIRYFTDIQNFKCKYTSKKEHNNIHQDICISPLKLYNDFTKIDLTKVESVLVLDQLLPNSSYHLYLHHEEDAETEITQSILSSSTASNITMTMREADYLPPGTGSYIYKFGHIKNVYTLSGYNTQYTNKNVNGLADIQYDYNLKQAHTMCTFVLQFISSYVYKMENVTALDCNSSTFNSFMSCFAINGNCTTVARYLYMDPVTLNAQFENEPASKFPGTYFPGRQPYMSIDGSYSVNSNQPYDGDLSVTFSPSLFETFYYYYMTEALSSPDVIHTACTTEHTCPAGQICVINRCYNSTVSFHDAYDIGLIAEPYPGTFSINETLSTPLYTEPFWGGFYGDEPYLYVYQYTPFYLDMIMLVLGIVATVLTWYLFDHVFLNKFGIKLKLD